MDADLCGLFMILQTAGVDLEPQGAFKFPPRWISECSILATDVSQKYILRSLKC